MVYHGFFLVVQTMHHPYIYTPGTGQKVFSEINPGAFICFFLRSPPAPDLHTLQMLMAANHCESASKNNLIFYDVVWYDESYIQTVNGQQNQ